MILVGRHPLQSFPTSGLRASPPAHPSPLSAKWDAICPPRRSRRCRYRATISTIAHPGYRPDADVHVLLLLPLVIIVVVSSPQGVDVTNDITMPSILSRSSTRSDDSAPQRPRRLFLSLPHPPSSRFHSLSSLLFPSSPPLQRETVSDARRANHSLWLSRACLPLRREGEHEGRCAVVNTKGDVPSLSSSASSRHFAGDSGDVDAPRLPPRDPCIRFVYSIANRRHGRPPPPRLLSSSSSSASRVTSYRHLSGG